MLCKGERVRYAEENALGPLWKGQDFPIEYCISGWAMIHAEKVVIEDIYADERIPLDATKLITGQLRSKRLKQFGYNSEFAGYSGRLINALARTGKMNAAIVGLADGISSGNQ